MAMGSARVGELVKKEFLKNEPQTKCSVTI